jgi:DNA repair protein RecO (recombination protein O)
MRNYKTEGIIIKRRNIGEADRLLTVFTKDQGKLLVKASGIRRIPSRRSAHVELLNHTALTLYKGQGHPVLTEATALDNFSAIKEDLTKVGYAYHLCELIDGLCPENQENEIIFTLFKNTLQRLATDDDILHTLHEFEIELLTLLGYWNSNTRTSSNFNTHDFIESILERKLKSHNIFIKLQ